MKLSFSRVTIAIAALGLAGCATPSSGPPAHGATAHGAPPAGPPARVVDLPASAGSGEPREMHVVVDQPGLKVATIVLRRGTVLPEHHSAVPVTIQALHGAGNVTVGGERLRIDAAHAVVLAPKVPHAVEPDPGSDLVLLVHHAGRGEETH